MVLTRQSRRPILVYLEQVEEGLNGDKLSLKVTETHFMLISTQPKHKTLDSSNESLTLKTRENEHEVFSKKLNILVYRLTTPWIGRNTLGQFCPRY